MTAFTTERWADKMLLTLKEAKGGFAGRIVNHNFHNPGGDKADAVKVINPTLTVVNFLSSAGYAMPTVSDAASTTLTINLDKPLRYAVGLPWEMQLKTEHDIEKGYRLTCEDQMVQQRNALVQAALDAAASIPVVTGTAATPTALTVDNVLSIISKFRVQLMKTGAIMENGTYRFVDVETQENVSELEKAQTPLDGGEDVPGVLGAQVATALPVLAVDSAIYELIINAATKAGELTENKEFYGHVPVIRGFELVLDEALNHSADSSNKYHGMFAGTRNLITEAFTASRAEVIPDQANFRDILRGMIVYGCAVTNVNCGARGYFSVA